MKNKNCGRKDILLVFFVAALVLTSVAFCVLILDFPWLVAFFGDTLGPWMESGFVSFWEATKQLF